MLPLTERYRIKFSYYESRPYIHIRDLGRDCDENKVGKHRFVTLNRDALFELQDVLPQFIERLLEYDETDDPECLKAVAEPPSDAETDEEPALKKKKNKSR